MYILTDEGTSIFQVKIVEKQENYFLLHHMKQNGYPARILLKVNQVNSLKGNKNRLNPKTVWEIILTHGLADAEVGRGRGCVTPF